MAAAAAGSASTLPRAAPSAAGSPGGTSSPDRPGLMTSRMPPTSVVTAGTPMATASSSARGRPSNRDPSTYASAPARSSTASVRRPRSPIRSPRPSDATCAATSSSRSPLPTSASRASGWAGTREANASTMPMGSLTASRRPTAMTPWTSGVQPSASRARARSAADGRGGTAMPLRTRWYWSGVPMWAASPVSRSCGVTTTSASVAWASDRSMVP